MTAFPARGFVALMRPYIERIKQDAWAYGVFALYAGGVSLLAVYLGEPRGAVWSLYFREWLLIPLFGAAAYLTHAIVRSARSPAPRTEFVHRLKVFYSPAVVCGLATYLLLGFFHGNFTVVKSLLERLAPFAWDPALARLDEVLHRRDPWQLIPRVEPLTRVLQWFYYPVWLIMLAGVSFYVSLLAPEGLRRQYLKTFFFCWIVLGNVLALVLLSAGPVYYDALYTSKRFTPLTDYLWFSRGLSYSSVDVSEYLWSLRLSATSAEGSGISAFPSLHLAMATLWCLTLRRIRPWLQWPMITFVVLLQVASVHLAWHYAIDGYFSIVATILIWRLFGFIAVERYAGTTQAPPSRDGRHGRKTGQVVT